MRLYSDDHISYATILQAADDTGLVVTRCVGPRTARKRKLSFNFQLGRFGSRRTFNSGTHGAVPHDGWAGAASHDDWGWFLARLYTLDPNMIVGTAYTSREDFGVKTAYKYGEWCLDPRHAAPCPLPCSGY